MKIAVLDDYHDVVRNLECFKLLHEHDVHVLTESYKNSQQLAQKIQDVEAIVLIRERTSVDDNLLSTLPQLRLIR